MTTENEEKTANAASTENLTSAQRIGNILVEEREKAGMTRADIAELLKLSIKQVQAIEEGKLEELPSPVFARGFLKNYVKRLGLEEKLAPLVDEVFPNPELKDLKQNLVKSYGDEGRKPIDPMVKKIILGVALLLVIFFFISLWQNKSNELNKNQVTSTKQIDETVESKPVIDNENVIVIPITQDDAGAKTADGKTDAAKGAAGDAKAQGAKPAASSGDENLLVLNVKAGARTSISNSKGKVLVNETAADDATYRVNEDPPYTVAIYNSDGASATFEGEDVDVKKHSWKGNTYFKIP